MRYTLISKIALFSVLSCFLLSACGFTPIYSQKNNSELSKKLAAIKVTPIHNLMGQKYVSALEDVLDPKNTHTANKYIIDAVLYKYVRPLAIEQDRTVTRYKVVVNVEYTLKDQADGKIISKGRIKGEADYDRVESDYATYVSENDTTDRVIKELAQDTKIKIISALLK